MIYGDHELPLKIETDGLSITMERLGDIIRYTRDLGDSIVEKQIATKVDRVIIHPVEPMLLPQQLTRLLLVDFEVPLNIQPGKSVEINLSVPVDIAVFPYEKNTGEPLDVFTLARTKLTLFGTPDTGHICRYWRSSIVEKPSTVEVHKEGWLSLTIRNDTGSWVQVNRTILEGHAMKLFFNENLVRMRGKMKITGKRLAETSVSDKSPQRGMTKSLEVMSQGLLKAFTGKFIMEGEL